MNNTLYFMHDGNVTVYSVNCKAGLKQFYRCKLNPRFAFISIVMRRPQASYRNNHMWEYTLC